MPTDENRRLRPETLRLAGPDSEPVKFIVN